MKYKILGIIVGGIPLWIIIGHWCIRYGWALIIPIATIILSFSTFTLFIYFGVQIFSKGSK